MCEPASGLPLLLVDDQRLNLLITAGIVASILPRRRLLTADGVVEARLVLHAHPRLDCAILDVSLTDGDGFMVLDAMRASGIRCPVIFYTAHAIETDARLRARVDALDNIRVVSKDQPWLLAASLREWFVPT